MQIEVSPFHSLYLDSNPSFNFSRISNFPIAWDNLNNNSVSSLIDICHQLGISVQQPFIKANLIKSIKNQISNKTPPEIPLYPSYDYVSSILPEQSNDIMNIALSRIPESYNQQTSSISSFFGSSNSYEPRVVSPFAKSLRNKNSSLSIHSKEKPQLKIENKEKTITDDFPQTNSPSQKPNDTSPTQIFEFSPKAKNSPTQSTNNNNNSKKTSKNKNRFLYINPNSQQTETKAPEPKPEKQYNQKKPSRNSPKSQAEVNQPPPPPPEPSQIVVNKNATTNQNQTSFGSTKTTPTIKPEMIKQNTTKQDKTSEPKQPHQTITMTPIPKNEANKFTKDNKNETSNDTHFKITKADKPLQLQKSTNQQQQKIKVESQPKQSENQPMFTKPIPLTTPEYKPTPKPENSKTLIKPLPMNLPEKPKTESNSSDKQSRLQPTKNENEKEQKTEVELKDTTDDLPKTISNIKNRGSKSQNRQNQQPKTKNKFDRQNNFFSNNVKSNQFKKPESKEKKKEMVDEPVEKEEKPPDIPKNEQKVEKSSDTEPIVKEKKKKALLKFYGLTGQQQKSIIRIIFVVMHLILLFLFYLLNGYRFTIPNRL